MRWISCFIIFFFSYSFLCQAQKGNEKLTPLLEQLESEAAKGNLIALRDLGTLLDKKSTSKEAQNILQTYTFFLENEFDWNQKIDRQTFLDFFYNYKNKIRFFHPAGVFYISALDVEKVDYKIESLPKNIQTQKTIVLRKSINAFEKAIEEKNGKKAEQKLALIIQLNTREARHYLLQVLQEEMLQKSTLDGKINLIIKLSHALQDYPTRATLEEILINVQSGFLPFKEGKNILARLTNHSMAEVDDAQSGIEYFVNLLDSLETMENIRYMGYEKIFNFNRFIFPHDVDYFGRIVFLANDYPWMKKNAIHDLMKTEHKRAYLYLAADFFKNHLAKSKNEVQPIISSKEYEDFFIESNQLVIKVLGDNKKYKNIFEEIQSSGCKDEVLKQNFLLYWLTHHEDFEWNQNYALYLNKHETLEKTENLEKHFRRLVSTNNEAAMESFQQLTVGAPTEVMNLSNKYRQLLRTYNKTLPNIRHLYLEQLAALTDFCRNNDIDYEPGSRLRQKLDQLRNDIPASERYDLENRIINSLEIQEVTAIEYYACLHENNSNFTFSIGRILDYFYSQHWEVVVQNDSQLRLYLKKAALYKRIGTIGSCNVYLNKLESKSRELNKRLNDLLEVEPDDDIIFLIELLSPKEEEVSNSDLQEFIDNPIDFSKNDIRVLPVASNENFQAIINQMKEETDVKVLKKYLAYLRANPVIRAVPIYFQLIDNQTFITKKYNLPVNLCDVMIPIIEGAYNHHYQPEKNNKPFATDKWRTLWKTDGKNFESWVDLFFEQKLKQLDFADKLKINIINDVFAAEDFKLKYKDICLTALTKVKPLRDIKKLKTPKKLSVKTDLRYFENFYFTYKDLDNIPRLFEVDEPTMMFDYLVERTVEFDETELGNFWNDIFTQNWFLEFLNSNPNRITEIKNIKAILQNYLEVSDVISESEEKITYLHISQIESIGKDLISKLEESIQSQKEESTKALIQQSILARASYNDIGKIVSVIDQLSSSQNFNPNLFLQKDFGLPIFDLENEKIRKEIITHHSKMREYDFYKYYLKEFGVDFLAKKGKLDFEKIYDLLQYEIVTPFVGGGGSHRDQFTYGLIKLLELHFETRLDFHVKLNENQTFYSFTSTKRAQAWRIYLTDNQLVKPNKSIPPSFNDVVNK
ncbi:MAG: hypothetical protein AB8H03_11300 [Saprospiraceae bacterium]